MSTYVTIEIVDDDDESATNDGLSRAFDWFRHVEACCSRFDPDSEVRQLACTTGVAVPVSAMLFEAVRVSLALAEDTHGAFDPTVGERMTQRGFNRHYRTGEIVPSCADAAGASYRDVELDHEARTITIHRPLVLDLGGVAKGLAVDLAARELQSFGDIAIDAGGDVYVRGHNAQGQPWTVGVRHPRESSALLDVLHVSNCAVCTSGDYERRGPLPGAESHLIDPRTGASAAPSISATVIAPTAMLADALATAAFVLGPEDGLALLERHGADGLVVSPTLVRHSTAGYPR